MRKLFIEESDKNKPGIYILHNSNTEQVYIGSTIDLNKRANDHFSRLERNKHFNWKLQRAYNKDPNFEFVGVAMDQFDNLVENRAEALFAEQVIINEFKDNSSLLNISMDVELTTLGYKHTEESLKKMSAARLGVKIHTEEAKKQMSISRMGNQHALGAVRSEEDKQRMSEFRTGNQYALGHRHTEETREQMSKAHTGIKKSESAILKAAEAKTKRRVLIDDVEYSNASTAASAIGLSREGINKRCLSTNFPNYSFKNKA